MDTLTFLRSIGKAPDATAIAFFHPSNVELLQARLRYEVHRCTGVVVGPQSAEAMTALMRAAFEEHSVHSGCGNVVGMFSGPNVRPGVFPNPRPCTAPTGVSIERLNENVLSRAVADVVTNLRRHRQYLEDISQPNPLPMHHPQFVASAGNRQLPSTFMPR
jgi:hypothetical protein